MFDKIKKKMQEIESNTSLTPEQKIQEITKLSDLLEDVACTIADEHKITFSVGDYGAGRTYYPAGQYTDWDDEVNDEGIWLSSSDQC